MAEQLQLEVVTPQRTIINKLVDTIILPGNTFCVTVKIVYELIPSIIWYIL